MVPISAQGRANLPPQLKKMIKMVYKPQLPVLFAPFEEINTGGGLSEFVFQNFGASEEGVYYRILYWQKLSHWRRRLKRLCLIKIFDTPDGFRYELIDMGGIKKFSWYKGGK